jgi:hypothetical protein
MILAFVADYLPSPQQAHHLYLLLDPSTARAEVFTKCLVLHSVPADPYPEAQPSTAKDIYLGRLFGNERVCRWGKTMTPVTSSRRCVTAAR